MFAFLTRPVRFLPRGPLDVLVQFAIVFCAYEAYRLSRGAIDDPLSTMSAFSNAEWVIHLERTLHLDIEQSTQRFAESVWGLSDVSSFLYINVQTTVTFAAMAYIYARHGAAFSFVRNMFVITWALAIVGFLLLPTAPPRLVPGLGIHDSVAAFTGVDPSAPRVSRFYNPYAAVPSLHVGVATMVGVSLARLSKHRPVRIAWGLYPLLVTFLVLATGNHYLFDAVVGALTAGVAALIARQLGRVLPHAPRLRTTARRRGTPVADFVAPPPDERAPPAAGRGGLAAARAGGGQREVEAVCGEDA